MDATKGNIYAILNGNKHFLIPVYQRLYSWEIEQCQRLWKDIVSMQKQHKVGHFVGSIVNIAEQAMPTGVQKYMIIDGQQRMTTLSLLLIALRDYGIKHPEDTTINPTRIDSHPDGPAPWLLPDRPCGSAANFAVARCGQPSVRYDWHRRTGTSHGPCRHRIQRFPSPGIF